MKSWTGNEIGVFDINFDTGECYWSFELKRMLGVRHDVPAEFHLLLQRIHPDDRRLSAGLRCSLFGPIARGTHRSSSASCTMMAACSGCTRNGERSCVRMIRKTSCGSSASRWKSARQHVCRARRDWNRWCGILPSRLRNVGSPVNAISPGWTEDSVFNSLPESVQKLIRD